MSALAAVPPDAGVRTASHEHGGVRVVEFGEGARLFFGLHGWSGSHASFSPLVERLPVDATLFAVDLPGVGPSEPPEAWTTDALVERVEVALERLELDPVALIAHCGALGVAMRLAGRRPDLVERLILVDPFTFVPWYLRLFTWPVLGRFFYFWTFGNPIGRWLTDGALAGRRKSGQSLTEGFQRMNARHNHGLLRAFCEAAERPLEEQASFRGPVDIIFGERTFGAVRVSVEALRRVFPRAQSFRVRGAGHMPLHESPDAVADLVFRAATREDDMDGGWNEPATAPAARLG